MSFSFSGHPRHCTHVEGIRPYMESEARNVTRETGKAPIGAGALYAG